LDERREGHKELKGKLHASGAEEISGLIRPAGYFNVKARRLKNFSDHLFNRNGGSLTRLLKKGTGELRSELLSINGIGPETADSIILYAAGLPEFVVDAYTKRIFARHGLAEKNAGYEELKSLFTGHLVPDAALFNEYHALIVRTGKEFCRNREPLCGRCPLGEHL
jgi:endonuclease-3 related protein